MIKVYIAGAYNDDNVLSVLKNIGRGEEEAAKLFMMGYAVFCPWFDKSFVIRHPEHKFDVKQFKDYSLEWLRVSDVVYIVPNMNGLKSWKDSRGTLDEIEEANKCKIPVVFSVEELVKIFPVEINTLEIFG
jgi:hypothetical protein